MSMNDMLEAYLFEMHSLLEQLDDLVLAAEQAHTFSQDDVNEIFRIMHTIKGSSAMMEFNPLMTIAHRIEDLFYVIREKGMDNIADEHKSDLFDLIFQSIDFFRANIERVEKNEPLDNSIDAFLDKINSFANKISGEEGAVEEEESAPAESGEVPSAVSAFGSPQFPYGLQVTFDEGVGMENLRAMMMVNSVRDFCEESEFDFYPADVQLNPDTANFIIDNGFFLRFRTAEERDAAMPAVRDNGAVKSWQEFLYEGGAAPEEEIPAVEDAAPESVEPAAQAAVAPSAPA
ncbi:MAG: Hpt domain-containing protein, partial [Oscillibacter sp.]|nr:Hpt domain-containing protein [Oscillibacter sp.]